MHRLSIREPPEGRCDFALHGMHRPGREALRPLGGQQQGVGAAACGQGLCEGGGAASIDRFAHDSIFTLASFTTLAHFSCSDG